MISQLKSTQIRVQLLNILGFFFKSSLELALMGKNFLINGFSGQEKKNMNETIMGMDRELRWQANNKIRQID